MTLGVNPNWLSAEMQAHIKPPPIPLAIPEEVQDRACNIIKVKMIRNHVSAGSETYEFKINIFKNWNPEGLLKFMKKVKKYIKGTGMMKIAGIINVLCTLLRG